MGLLLMDMKHPVETMHDCRDCIGHLYWGSHCITNNIKQTPWNILKNKIKILAFPFNFFPTIHGNLLEKKLKQRNRTVSLKVSNNNTYVGLSV